MIDAALVDARVDGTSLRTIADRFGVSKTALIRHRDADLPEVVAAGERASTPKRTTEADRQEADQPVVPDHAPALAAQVAEQQASEARHGIDVLARLERYIARLEMLWAACHAYLLDPADATRYSLEPRAHEVDVIYYEQQGMRAVRKKEKLSALLDMLFTQKGLQIERNETKVADPRELVLKTVAQSRGLLELYAEVVAKARTLADMEMFEAIVLEAIEEAAPDVREAIDRSLERRQPLLGLPVADPDTGA